MIERKGYEMTAYVVYYMLLFAIYYLPNKNLVRNKFMKIESTSSDYAYSGRKKSIEKYFVFTSIFLLILLIGLRHQTMGVDLGQYSGYLASFKKISSLSWLQIFKMNSFLNYEKGYVIFNKLIGMFSSDRQVFLFVCAIFTLAPIGLCIYKYSKNTLMSFVIYLGLPVFLSVFSPIRQAIAIGITVYAYRYIREKRIVPYFLTIALAGMFHKSAFIMIIAYPIYRIKLDKKAAYASVGLLPIIYALKYPLFSILSKIFKRGAVAVDTGAFTLFLVFSIVYSFCVVYGQRSKEETNGLSNLFWVACAIQAMAGVFPTVTRVSWYFMMYLILLVPEVLEDMKRTSTSNQRIIFWWVILLCFLVYGYYSIEHGGWAMSYPYYFFWETIK